MNETMMHNPGIRRIPPLTAQPSIKQPYQATFANWGWGDCVIITVTPVVTSLLSLRTAEVYRRFKVTKIFEPVLSLRERGGLWRRWSRLGSLKSRTNGLFIPRLLPRRWLRSLSDGREGPPGDPQATPLTQ